MNKINEHCKLFSGKSLLTNERVYGELCCDCFVGDDGYLYIINDRYYIREYYIDKNFNLNYVYHYVNNDSVEGCCL